MDATTLEVRLSRLPLLVASLQNHPEISAAYVGYQDGDFFLVRRFDPDSYLGHALSAPKESAYVVQSISRDAEGLREAAQTQASQGPRLPQTSTDTVCGHLHSKESPVGVHTEAQGEGYRAPDRLFV